MQHPPNEPAVAPPTEQGWIRWLYVAAVAAVVLAVAAGIYRHEERREADHAAAESVVIRGKTRDLQTKLTAATSNLSASRADLRARTALSPTLLRALDQLNANHKNMTAFVHDHDVTSTQIVDVLAGGQPARYDALVDHFATSNRMLDALAATETKLQNDLDHSACGGSCGATEASFEFPSR